MQHQAENVPGTPIKFVELDRQIQLHRHTAQAELQREVGTLNLHMKKSENVSNQTARRVRRRRRRY